ncbi:SsgA family sporulation/cell division regulator [Sciscionella sediminilitoris]|uniref:SsgA family sporulation/cell division regulator n=1 Tax=Sciscionella sediminilitoris TaxID=1445613 RepID=UPI0012E14FEB|nr:SsgA family sporulation/cell division regulator [Sciscionella sp. SE31]
MRYDVTVERTLLFEMSTGGTTTVPIEVDLAFYECDPLAVHLAFRISEERWIHWTFARDLLVEGIAGPAGDGDVRFWPLDDGSVLVEVSVPERGAARFLADIHELTTFVDQTYHEVDAERAQAIVEEEIGQYPWRHSIHRP